MTKEQQIEEIAKIQCDCCMKIDGCSHKNPADNIYCLRTRLKHAETLYDAGYMKQSEVAKLFAKKLKERMYAENSPCKGYVIEDDIDELLKEFQDV